MSDTNETSAISDTSGSNEASAGNDAPANASGTAVQPVAAAAEAHAASALDDPVATDGSAAVNPSAADGGPADGSTETVRNNFGRPVTFIIVAAPAGKSLKVSWVWQVVRKFKSPVNRNVLRRGVRTKGGHFVTRIAKKGTTGLLKHVKKEHREEYEMLKKQYGNREEAKEEVVKAIARIPSAQVEERTIG